MKILFIINPISGTKTLQRSIPNYVQELNRTCDFSECVLYKTRKKNDARNKAASLQKHEFDLIVAVGGDGTVNEVVTGMIEGQCDIPLAIIPAGTVNDFGKYLQIPTRPQEFAQMISNNHVEYIDVGKIDDSYFINVISGGMFSDIGFQVTKEEKNLLGPLAYYLNGLKSFNDEIQTQLHLTIRSEITTIEEEASLFLLTNSSFVGGFQNIAPLANIQDGLLDLLIIKKTDVLDLMSIVKDYSSFFHNHIEHPSVRYLQAKQFEISCQEKITYDVDGEKGEHFPIVVECLHQAIPMVVMHKESL